jgi:hypothetical protein
MVSAVPAIKSSPVRSSALHVAPSRSLLVDADEARSGQFVRLKYLDGHLQLGRGLKDAWRQRRDNGWQGCSVRWMRLARSAPVG